MNDQHIDIKIVLDPGCPWCLIGGKRLEQAMAKAREQGFSFRVKWLPFMLAPDTGTEGTPSRAHMIAMMGEQAYAASRERMRPIGKSIGIRASIASCPYMRASGVRGVPVFAFNDKYILTGGQEVDAFLQVFDQVAAA